MKTIAAVLLAFALAPLSHAQSKNAPTAQQCTADLNAWYLTGQTDADRLSYEEIARRISELTSCGAQAAVIRDSSQTRYDNLADRYQLSLTQRLFHFLERHGEMSQFVKEDTAGKR